MGPARTPALTFAILVALTSAAAAECRPAAATFSAPFASPCGGGTAKVMPAARPATSGGPGAAGPVHSRPADSDDDEGPSVAVPLGNGVGLDGRLGTDRTSLPIVQAIDDAANRRRTAQPRTPVFSESGLRGGAAQAMKRKAGDGALLGLSFDLPQ